MMDDNIFHVDKKNTRKIKFNEKQVQYIRKLYIEDKMSSQKIGKLFNVSPPTIQKILRELGIIRSVGKSNTKYKQNNNYFKIIDTEDKAYWLGFIYADGYITKNNQLRINLQIKDENHLVKFYKFIESDREVKYTKKISGNKIYYGCYAYIANTDFTKHLISKGCTNNKSLNLKFPTYDIVPKDLIYHFIRGYFDGDGSIFVSRIDKNTNHKYIKINFTGTYGMILNIRTHLNCNNIKLENKGNFYVLSINGNHQVFNILDNYIYKDATIYLDRKYEKYRKFKELYLYGLL